MECLLVITPCLFAAVRRDDSHQVHFTSIGRVATMFPRKYSLIRPIYVMPVFVTIDVFSLFVQAAGAALAGSADSASSSHTGSMIVVGGVALQLAGYLLFNFVFISFWLRVRKDRTPQLERMEPFLYAVLVSSIFIILRSIFRVIEMGLGWKGVINSTEWTLYVFDGALIVIAVTILNVYNPSKYLPKHFSWRHDADKQMELEKASADQYGSDAAMHDPEAGAASVAGTQGHPTVEPAPLPEAAQPGANAPGADAAHGTGAAMQSTAPAGNTPAPALPWAKSSFAPTLS